MDWLQAADLQLGRLLFERALGAIYLIAFLVAANQFPALLGERGLLPAPRFLAAVPFRRAPSLFHLRYSDRVFAAVAWAGVVLAAAVVAGIPRRARVGFDARLVGPVGAVPLDRQRRASLLWLRVGVAAPRGGFLAIFLGPASVAPPTVILWLIRWLLFRVEFGAA